MSSITFFFYVLIYDIINIVMFVIKRLESPYTWYAAFHYTEILMLLEVDGLC